MGFKTICSVYLSKKFKNSLTKEEYENVMYKNAIRIFNLKNIEILNNVIIRKAGK